MVLTDLPFERGTLIHQRYNLLRRPGSAPAFKRDEDEKKEQSKTYATFLREQERKVDPELGFLDSSRFTNPYVVKKNKERTKLSHSGSGKPSIVSLSNRIANGQKEHNKRIKVIEDHMWQHKQEERELKRIEGDIIKNQRAVRHTMRDFENAINKKRLEEEKKLNQGLEKYTVIQREHIHRKEESTKERLQQTLNFEQGSKSVGRKNELTKSDTARKYKAKMSEIELKRIELMRLNQEYESKMRSKEEEEHRLQQELTDLAITLNMEAQKGRKQQFDLNKEKKRQETNKINEDVSADKSVENKMMRSDGDTKAAESNKRKLSADLNVTKSHLDIKKRDETRHLTDTQFRLTDNSNTQRQLNEAALHAEMDLKAKQIQQKLESHNARRVHYMTTNLRNKKEKEEAQQLVWEGRFKRRNADQERRKHEDSLKFFKKMVTKGEDQEKNLYNQVRNSEYARQKQEQNVRRLQQQLAEIKRKNSIKIREELSERQRLEREIEQTYIREKAELDKAHAEREESYIKLQKHRQYLKEDKYQLEEHEREHVRLLRVGNVTDSSAAEVY
ncbi:trichohyalin-like [Mytilus californianus]|uniref:trichohyalin-like n=1 Tax=Mytilus californianus TaxID=6549 RepID=UPI0022486AB3|nr:trichohyalin-like [Mytilus californianus]